MRPFWVCLLLPWFVVQLVAALPTPQPEFKDGTLPQEINPVKAKFRTIPDPDMSGYPDFSVLAKDDLSSWDDDSWTLTTTKYMPGMFQTRLGLANGYAGANVAVTGPFFERDSNQTNHNGDQPSEGWPLRNPRQTFATISGFYDCQDSTPETNFEELRDRGCESVIAGTPHPLALLLRVGDQVLDSTVDSSAINDFQQTMRFRDGIEEWKYTWSPPNTSVHFDIEYQAFIHRTRPNVAATELRVTPRGGNYNASIIDLLDGRSAVRSSLVQKDMLPNAPSIYVSNHPAGLPEIKAWTFSTINVSNGYIDESSRRRPTDLEAPSDMSIGQEWDVKLVDGETAVFQKFAGLASSDKFPESESTASQESVRALNDGWNRIKLEHVKEWNRLMCENCVTSLRDPATNILPENDTIKQLQIVWITSHYYMLQNLLRENGNNLNDDSVSVGGLTSDSYAGFKFWDAETWMFPALAATNPDMAKQILKYRVKLFPQAKANAQEEYVQARYSFDNESALFPWTSGRYGNATGTGPVMDYEYHLNADIALMAFHHLRITGDNEHFKEDLWPIVNGVGHSIATLLVKKGNKYWIKNMTDPDEYANHIDNGAYTLGSFSKVLGLIIEYQNRTGMMVNQTWVDMRDNIAIAKAPDSGITKQYQTMQNDITVKQADVSLLTYPLDLPNYNLDDSVRDLRYYNQHQTPDGPAMTSAIAAIDENRVAKSGCAAFTYNVQSVIPNLRAPWYQFSEQVNDDANANGGTDPAFAFLTGHGGALQIPMYGYLGVSIAKEQLTIRPNLPLPLEHMKVPDFYYGGNRFRAVMNNTHTSITRLPPSAGVSGVMDHYPGKPMPLIVQTRSVDEHGNRIVKDNEMSISMDETITVENDHYWRALTTDNNLLQCKPTESDDVGDHYVGAATDGNPATHWQAATRTPTNVTVDTSGERSQSVKQIKVDWGVRTPESARVFLTNSTEVDRDRNATVIDIGPIRVNTRCDGSTYTPRTKENDAIEIRQGNCTVYDVSEKVWTGKHAILEVAGCQACESQQTVLKNGTVVDRGATVAEFEIIGFGES